MFKLSNCNYRMANDYYETLQINRNASDADIKKA